ncbi:MAG TPA: polysaccharide biosynthesis/export family protein [Minicystis sp.]|nr:polysaccharide biosynthesis/export family protein [Minicystis sp.]
MRTPALSVVLLAAAACGCASTYANYDYKKEYDPRRHEYRIGVGDALQVNVFHQPDLSGTATVRPDGIITLPLVGDVSVAGKTPSEVREEIKKDIARYVRDESAVVTVAVTNANSYRFVVAGNVGHPGTFTEHYYVSVSEAIAMAGGLGRFAGDEIVILRPSAHGQVRQIPVNYAEITSGRHPEQDIPLVAGDTVFVP